MDDNYGMLLSCFWFFIHYKFSTLLQIQAFPWLQPPPHPTPLKGRPIMAAFDCTHFQSCFDDWIAQQHKDLHELLRSHSSDSEPDNEKLKLLAEKCIKHFEDYCEKRAIMAQSNAPCFISPSWCSSFENAFLWIGGCRPSLSIRLLYLVCGTELNDHLEEFLLGERKDNLAQISAQQLQMVNTLHCKTIREEDRMSSGMATLQVHTLTFVTILLFEVQ